jgi:predicted DNA-binding transcriptional regulator AlpA
MQARQDYTSANPLLGASEVSKLLHLSRQRVYILIKRGILPSCLVAGAIKVPRGAFETWLNQLEGEALGRMAHSGSEQNGK